VDYKEESAYIAPRLGDFGLELQRLDSDELYISQQGKARRWPEAKYLILEVVLTSLLVGFLLWQGQPVVAMVAGTLGFLMLVYTFYEGRHSSIYLLRLSRRDNLIQMQDFKSYRIRKKLPAGAAESVLLRGSSFKGTDAVPNYTFNLCVKYGGRSIRLLTLTGKDRSKCESTARDLGNLLSAYLGKDFRYDGLKGQV
jgi:hypothetical protein